MVGEFGPGNSCVGVDEGEHCVLFSSNFQDADAWKLSTPATTLSK